MGISLQRLHNEYNKKARLPNKTTRDEQKLHQIESEASDEIQVRYVVLRYVVKGTSR